MKKVNKLFLLLTLFCVAGGVHAQIAIGPKVGINIGTFRGDDVESDDAENLLGVTLGAVANIGITENFSIMPEVLFFQKGAEQTLFEDPNDSETKTERETTLNYVEIPVLAKYAFSIGQGPELFVIGGPSFGIGLGGNISETNLSDRDIDFEEDMITNFDFSVALGGGISLPVGPGSLIFDIRYLLSLTSIDDSEFDRDIKNNGIAASVGFLYPLTK